MHQLLVKTFNSPINVFSLYAAQFLLHKLFCCIGYEGKLNRLIINVKINPD